MTVNILDTIQLKPHYAQHVADDRCVYLFSDAHTWALNGRAFTLLLPLIASRAVRVEDIIARTCDAISPEYMLYAIDRLLEADLVCAGPASSDASDVFWWSSDVDPADARDRLGSFAVSVRSFGLPAGLEGTLGGMLEKLGVATQPGRTPALVILLANDYLNAELAGAIEGLSRDKRDWLVVKPVGRQVWIGPWSRQGGVCWQCVTVRLLENRLGQHVLPDDVRASCVPPLAALPLQTECTLNLVASWIARSTGLGKAVVTGEQIQVLDLDTLETSAHYILGNPGCACGRQASRQREQLNLDYDRSFTRYENGYRVASALETYSRVSRLVSPVSGLIPELCRSDQYDSSYIYYARHGFTVSEELSANRIAGRPSWACGKGSTDIDARVSCVAEAIERYSSGYFGNEPTRCARMDELENAIDPGRILLFSDSQYANRERANSSSNAFDWIPEPFNPELPIEWKHCAALDGGGDAWVPARLCYLNYPDTGGHVFCRADSNGCATGNTVEEALLFGLFELIERDAVSIWWFNNLMLPGVDLVSFGDHAIDRVAESLRSDDRELIVIDITSDLGVYTFACVSWCSRNRNRVYIGYGTHLDPVIAIKRALNEVIQVASYLKENDVSGNPALNGWVNHTSLADLPFLAGNRQTLKSKDDYRKRTTGNLVTDITECVDLLAASALRAYFVDMTRGDALLPTVRVIVPGLRHFWPRFAPGRLYDVPVKQGLLADKTPENELNRFYYPL